MTSGKGTGVALTAKNSDNKKKEQNESLLVCRRKRTSEKRGTPVSFLLGEKK